MYVYVIVSDAGHHKIGIAHSPKNRLNQIRVGCPFELFIAETMRCPSEDAARQVERLAHSRLAEFRGAGEWFSVPKEDAIRAVHLSHREVCPDIANGEIPPYGRPMLTPAQIRAARALLGWKQTDLASASGVSEISIKNIERGATDARGSTLGKIQAALEVAGVVLLEPGDVRTGGQGVRMK